MASKSRKIIFYHTRVCTRCRRVNRILQEIEKENADLVVERRTLLNPTIKQIPTIIFGKNRIGGRGITKMDILGLLEEKYEN